MIKYENFEEHSVSRKEERISKNITKERNRTKGQHTHIHTTDSNSSNSPPVFKLPEVKGCIFISQFSKYICKVDIGNIVELPCITIGTPQPYISWYSVDQ